MSCCVCLSFYPCASSFHPTCLHCRPWSADPAWTTQSGWFHHDRNPVGFLGASVDKPTYVQGVVNLLPTTPGSGGNVVLPRSHLFYSKLVQQFGVEEEVTDTQGQHATTQYNRRVSMQDGYEEQLLLHHPELFEGAIVAHLEVFS